MSDSIFRFVVDWVVLKIKSICCHPIFRVRLVRQIVWVHLEMFLPTTWTLERTIDMASINTGRLAKSTMVVRVVSAEPHHLGDCRKISRTQAQIRMEGKERFVGPVMDTWYSSLQLQ